MSRAPSPTIRARATIPNGPFAACLTLPQLQGAGRVSSICDDPGAGESFESSCAQRSPSPSTRTFLRSPRTPLPEPVSPLASAVPMALFSRVRRNNTRWPGRPVGLMAGRVRGSTPRGGRRSGPLGSAVVAWTRTSCRRQPPPPGEPLTAPRAPASPSPAFPRVRPAPAR